MLGTGEDLEKGSGTLLRIFPEATFRKQLILARPLRIIPFLVEWFSVFAIEQRKPAGVVGVPKSFTYEQSLIKNRAK